MFCNTNKKSHAIESLLIKDASLQSAALLLKDCFPGVFL